MEEDDRSFTSYSIIPSGEIHESDVAATAEWLREHGASWDRAAPKGRRPTAREVRIALDGLSGYRATYDQGPFRFRAVVETLQAHALDLRFPERGDAADFARCVGQPARGRATPGDRDRLGNPDPSLDLIYNELLSSSEWDQRMTAAYI
jgi:hypothetical protein